MQNSPTIISSPPPLSFLPPPRPVGQVVVLPEPSPPFRPFAGAPSSVFQITVLPAPPPPPLFSDESSSVDLSPLDVPAVEVAGVKYQKETHAREIGGECPVCLSVFADGEEIRQLSVCKHSFHVSCIDLWLSNHSNCPICRATIAAAVKRSDSNREGDLQQGHRDASSMV
ncbi:RING-H2 finger protein ATL33-like [Cicer arietinum]|uniref:RING-H2 finger protein ATL33-like n=1 Tax=Cicer arietinum TaxID=3827 RepID=UPI003CC53D51